ncbi:MAG: hypothetical protein WA871_06935 [Candidatus Acidiferrales bacterium]
MTRAKRILGLIFLASTITLPVITTVGCAARVGYSVYDPYYGDYHTWDNGEDVYYRGWLSTNHRSYVKYNNLSKDDQKAYWTYRHGQPDHGNGHPAPDHH